MPKITIDGREHSIASDDRNLLDVCLSLGYDLPYFCWHPALGSVGACRQCAVIKYAGEDDDTGKLVMACMEPVVDGLRISISDPAAAEFRAHVIAWLMVNHPHDCPVCDEGGECHLQDMTVMTGHSYRDFRFQKRTFRNQDLGPFINHEMNRCIQCFRCVRFYRDYAGGKDLNSFASRDHTYFGRHEDGTLESEFSGNLVEVCPTGVFTDKSLKQHYTRKWDLQNAPSVCVHCSLGCNIIAGERSGVLRRVVNRYNSRVNGYFLCDRGRFGYEFVNSPDRYRYALQRRSRDAGFEPAGPGGIVEELRGRLAAAGRVIGIGSARASLEANYALRRLVGEENFYHGVSAGQYELTRRALEILGEGPNRTPSLSECGRADAVVILGEDPTNTAPMLDLGIRQAVRNGPLKKARAKNLNLWNDAAVRELLQEEKGPLYLSTPGRTKLDAIATAVHRAEPVGTARFAMAVAHAVDAEAPVPDELEPGLRDLAQRAADDLLAADNPLIVTGTSCGEPAVLEAAANIARALERKNKKTGLCVTFPECNSLGLAMMGGRPIDQAITAVENEPADVLIVLETDLYRHLETREADRLMERSRLVVVLDSLQTATGSHADIVLPAGTFAESDGTLVNNEGRAQRFYKAFSPKENILQSRQWLSRLSDNEIPERLTELVHRMTADLPQFKGIEDQAPPENLKIPRQSHRYSGRTALKAHIQVSEAKPPQDPDSPLAFSMEGMRAHMPPSHLPLIWAPRWNSAQAINKFQPEIAGPLQGGDPGIRLIEPAGRDKEFIRPATGDNSKISGLRIVPLYHIYGSEELSSRAAALSKRVPDPYVALSPEDADRLDLKEGSEIELTSGAVTVRLPVHLKRDLPAGVIGYPSGLPGQPAMKLPGGAGIRKVDQ